MVKIDLSIVIVSWNTKKITEDCIESINRSLTNTKINYEIIVVDNDSRDGSAQTLQKIVLNKESHLVYFQSGSNLGFGRGNNFGVKKANGKYILLLNTDMIVLNRAIEKLYNFYIQNEKQVHFLGAKLLNHDLTPQPSACRFFTLPVVFATLLLKGDYWGLTRYSPNKFCRIDWIYRDKVAGDFPFCFCPHRKSERWSPETFPTETPASFKNPRNIRKSVR